MRNAERQQGTHKRHDENHWIIPSKSVSGSVTLRALVGRLGFILGEKALPAARKEATKRKNFILARLQ